ncbi:MAG: GldG family protein [Clostridiales bacterium]|nr:GldG family protein [Clostridiales bacterium]
MNRILQSFTDKKFKYGAFSAIAVILIVAALIVVNLIVGRFNKSFDLTEEKQYSLSEESKEVLRVLNEDVRIYALFKENSSDSMQMDIAGELLTQYEQFTPRITVEYRDPELYPQFVEQYTPAGEQIENGSIIVESARRHKVLQASDLVTTEFDYQYFQERMTSIDVEPQVTNAVAYVTRENTPAIYTITGHDDLTLPEEFKKRMSLSNYEFKEWDLLLENTPEDCSLLFVTQPSRDWNEEEAGKVRDYLQNDGSAVFVLDYTDQALPNLTGVLESYGVQMSGSIILEGSSNHYFNDNPFYLVPNYSGDHEITQTLVSKGYRSFVPFAQAVNEMELKKNTLKFERLMYTSNQAYGKANPNEATVGRQEGDPSGEFTLAAAVTDSYYTDKSYETKLIVLGSSLFLSATSDSYVGGANYEFILSCINWTQGEEQSMYIRSYMGTTSYLEMTQLQANFFFVLYVIVLPVGIFAAGFVIWLRRRHS